MKLVALLLAGGKGTRLFKITKKVPKPAVGFAAKYRIIDFALSNCVRSKIDQIGIVTQYESIPLNNYIGSGKHWGFDGVYSRITLLPPRTTESGGKFFMGTADATYQNIDYLESLNAEYVLILSGDHIYNMDYNFMLADHIKRNADLTIACLNVDKTEASRFGIMTINENDKILKFEEKPKNPISTLASMGIYIFTFSVLKKYLNKASKLNKEEVDFGKDIIPMMLDDKCAVYSYLHKGYWRDVGTVESLYLANMDLIDNDDLGIFSGTKLYSEDTKASPMLIEGSGSITNSIASQGSIILGEVTHSVLFNNIVVEKNAKVIDSIVMEGAVIRENAVIYKTIVLENTVVEKNTITNESEQIVTYGK